MSVASTNSVLSALVARLTALRWGSAALFETVALYDLSDLETALAELVSLNSRVCLVIYEGDQYTNTKQGNQLRTNVRRTATLVMSDQAIADRALALAGTANNPGIYAMKDAAAAACFGLDVSGVYVQATTGEPMVLNDAARANMPGRVCWTLNLEMNGGEILTRLGTQPIP